MNYLLILFLVPVVVAAMVYTVIYPLAERLIRRWILRRTRRDFEEILSFRKFIERLKND